MNNQIELFEQQHLEAFQQLQIVTKQRKKLEAEDSKIRQELIDAMDKYDIKSIDNDYVKITRIAGSESVSIDLKRMEKKEPELYSSLLDDYPKITKRKESVRITVK